MLRCNVYNVGGVENEEKWTKDRTLGDAKEDGEVLDEHPPSFIL